MNLEQKLALRRELLDLFDRYNLDVAVGTTRHGVMIGSQDKRVDAQNIGPVTAYTPLWSPGGE